METINTGNRQMLYEGMTPAQLHTAIIEDREDSPAVLHYLLYVRMHGALEKIFYKYFPNTHDWSERAMTFEDSMSDFYLYLYRGSSVRKNKQENFCYLKRLKDSQALAGWVCQTYSNILKRALEALARFEEIVPDVQQEERYNARREEEIDIARIAYTMAWLNQKESVLNRYVFFRAVLAVMFDNPEIVRRPNNEQVAEILGLSYATYRARVSRMYDRCSKTMHTICNAEIRQLSASNLILANSIRDTEASLETIVRKLLVTAESELPAEQYSRILELRKEKMAKSMCPRDYMPDSDAIATAMVCDDMDYAMPVPCMSKSFSKSDFLADLFDGHESNETKALRLKKYMLEKRREYEKERKARNTGQRRTLVRRIMAAFLWD